MRNYCIKTIVVLLAFSIGVAGTRIYSSVTYSSSLSAQKPQSRALPDRDSSAPRTELTKQKPTSPLERGPDFEDYPIRKIYKGRSAPLRLSRYDEPDRNRLEFAVENQEVNFAGRYILTSWSCGMWCSTVAIIDAKTGIVSWFPGVPQVCFPHLDQEFDCNEDFQNVEFNVRSKLLVLFGFGSDESPRGFHYYKFERGRLVHIKSIPVREQRNAHQIQLDEFEDSAAAAKNVALGSIIIN